MRSLDISQIECAVVEDDGETQTYIGFGFEITEDGAELLIVEWQECHDADSVWKSSLKVKRRIGLAAAEDVSAAFGKTVRVARTELLAARRN